MSTSAQSSSRFKALPGLLRDLERGHAAKIDDCVPLGQPSNGDFSRPMNDTRPLVFWIVAVALAVMMVVLLRQVLLPFVAGFALAYLLDPLANRLERFGVNRAAATLLLLGLFILGVITLLMVAVPIVGAEIAALIENLPAYVKRAQALVVDPNHPWLSKIIGVGLIEAQH